MSNKLISLLRRLMGLGPSRHEVLAVITEHYLQSRDFNGITAGTLSSNLSVSWRRLTNTIQGLLQDDLIEVLCGSSSMNPHIRRFPAKDRDSEIACLQSSEPSQVCLYPKKSHLQSAVARLDYEGRPYSLELALGCSQIEHRAFDLSVLEFYRNDPRFYYRNDDVRGSVSIGDESDDGPEGDQTLLQTFGFCYSEDLDRAVAVFLCYLSKLSAEHQQLWRARELKGRYELHPDYYRNAILGEWGERISVFDAFLEEMHVVNLMCDAMGRAHFFRKTFKGNRPRKLGFLARPTLEEFNASVLLLDKLLSDNINVAFFDGDVEIEREEERSDGKKVVIRKGTLQLLEEWLEKSFKTPDRDPIDTMLSSLRRIRKLRQKPAHAIKEDLIDQKYFKQHRQLAIDVHLAVQTLRAIFENHPRVVAGDVQAPEHLNQAVWTY